MDHYKIQLANEVTVALFVETATKLANANVPEPILAALAIARLSHPCKPRGGVRGIAARQVAPTAAAQAYVRRWTALFAARWPPACCSSRCSGRRVLMVHSRLSDLLADARCGQPGGERRRRTSRQQSRQQRRLRRNSR